MSLNFLKNILTSSNFDVDQLILKFFEEKIKLFFELLKKIKIGIFENDQYYD